LESVLVQDSFATASAFYSQISMLHVSWVEQMKSDSRVFVFIARQQRSMLMRDIDIANLSVCPSVRNRYQMKTA